MGLRSDLGQEPPLASGFNQGADLFNFVRPETVGGVLYVVEGATMGGSQIDRAAQRTLSTKDISGRRYWAWCRANARHRWPMVQADLMERYPEPDAYEAPVAGAARTFELFGQWLAPLNNPAHRTSDF